MDPAMAAHRGLGSIGSHMTKHKTDNKCMRVLFTRILVVYKKASEQRDTTQEQQTGTGGV